MYLSMGIIFIYWDNKLTTIRKSDCWTLDSNTYDRYALRRVDIKFNLGIVEEIKDALSDRFLILNTIGSHEDAFSYLDKEK